MSKLSSEKSNKICIFPKLSGLGGPVSFYNRLSEGLRNRGIELTDSPLDPTCSSVLIIGGSWKLEMLLRMHLQGKRIVQRLNGMTWIHRKTKTSLRYYLKSEMNNRNLAFIRRRVASQVVYQSNFARTWWRTVYKASPADGPIIYNGIDLHAFSPNGPERPPQDHFRILLVEAHISGGYEKGLENAIQLVRSVQNKITTPIELVVVGDVEQGIKNYWQNRDDLWINWLGKVTRDQIPAIDRSAHMLFSSDLNAACPNSVIEALACGLPVISYATGSLPELVQGDSGRVVPYGSNYWNLEAPDVSGLCTAACEIVSDQARFRSAARAQAETLFGLDTMVDKYIQALFP